MIVSELVFRWFVIVSIAGSALVMLAIDLVKLRRALEAPQRNRDFVFGCLVGIAIMVLGLIGMIKYAM